MTEIADFLFYNILRLEPGSRLITGDFQHDFVYVLLLPSVLLILILWEFGVMFAGDRKSVKTLVSITGLAVIIVSGWYGTIASFGMYLFPLFLAVFIITWSKRKVVSREAEGALTGLGIKGLKHIKGKIKIEDTAKKLAIRLNEIDAELESFKDIKTEKLNDPTLIREIAQLNGERREVVRELTDIISNDKARKIIRGILQEDKFKKMFGD